MYEVVTPVRFIRTMQSGRTRPFLIECEKKDGDLIELVVKCSKKAQEGALNLAFEAIAGSLAQDLTLPVPDFFLVKLHKDFIETISCKSTRSIFDHSDIYAFGSQHLNGYRIWAKDERVPINLRRLATQIFVFDVVTINPDRRPENPNCLTTGSKANTKLAIIDHELCFYKFISWLPPWESSGFDFYAHPCKHIFGKPYNKAPQDLEAFVRRWKQLGEERIKEYFSGLPGSWSIEKERLEQTFELLLESKANIRQITQNALKVLS